VDFPVSSAQQPPPFPWRTAALAATVVAAAELVVLLVVAGGPLITNADTAPKPAAKPAGTATTKRPASAVKTPPAADLPRRRVSVVVLNGNGRQGAAAATSSRIEGRGYRISAVGNAPSHDYPSSLVMYRPGFAAEGKRLARDLGIRLVSPLDGMRPGQLHGAHTVVILGS
jgi:LytR cell envelope-related transcriptional attenuator